MRSQRRRFGDPAPLSLLGAKRLSAAEFICVTELVLLVCVPSMLQNAALPRAFSRFDFGSLESRQFGVLLLIGLIGIVLYAFGLGRDIQL